MYKNKEVPNIFFSSQAVDTLYGMITKVPAKEALGWIGALKRTLLSGKLK